MYSQYARDWVRVTETTRPTRHELEKLLWVPELLVGDADPPLVTGGSWLMIKKRRGAESTLMWDLKKWVFCIRVQVRVWVPESIKVSFILFACLSHSLLQTVRERVKSCSGYNAASCSIGGITNSQRSPWEAAWRGRPGSDSFPAPMLSNPRTKGSFVADMRRAAGLARQSGSLSCTERAGLTQTPLVAH